MQILEWSIRNASIRLRWYKLEWAIRIKNIRVKLSNEVLEWGISITNIRVRHNECKT